MTFKTKAIGLLAGSALALSVMSGAMAAVDSATGNGTATLSKSDDPTADCSVVLNSDLSFGTYLWNSSTSEYVFQNDAAAAGATVSQNIAGGTQDCHVRATIDDLVLNTNNTIISTGNITLQINTTGSSTATIPTEFSGTTFDVSGTITASAIANTLDAGDYTGTLTVEASKSSF